MPLFSRGSCSSAAPCGIAARPPAGLHPQLVKRIGEPVVKAVETTVDIVKRLVTEGPMALWEMIKEKAEEIKQ